ncbi:MAG: helicase [Caudoviricetes sp.]|nr:MAG: helicase [Caudoviricetes sp.]
MQNHYNREIQKELISYMITDGELYTRCQTILKKDYFDSKLQKTVEFIQEYVNEFSAMPTPEIINGYTDIDIKLKTPQECNNQSKWFLDTIEKFCRHKSMEILLMEGIELVKKEDIGEMERRVKECALISLQKDLGTDYFKNPLERLNSMKDRTDMTSTGWLTLDKVLYGGTNKGELMIFAGRPGEGKSLILQNQAINWMMQGKNVLYVTLELSEDLIGLRWDAMLTEQTTKSVFGSMEEVAARLGLMKVNNKQWGKLQIKKFPEGSTNVNHIKSYIKEYEIQTGLKFDAICVDYLDLLYPTSNKIDINNIFLKDKMVSEELRAMAIEFKLLCCTASQLNKGSIQETDFDMSHLAGGISKLNTADNVIAIFAPAALKDMGEFQLQFIKTRSSAGVGIKINLSFDKKSLRITDMTMIHDDDDDGVLEKKSTKKVEALDNVDSVTTNKEKPSDINSLISSRLNRHK